MFRVRTLIGLALFAAPIPAQIALQNPRDINAVERLLNGEMSGEKLNCHLQTYKPFLDFAFRFESGYVVRCSLGQFEGREAAIAAYTRVTPVNGTPLVLGDRFQIPAIPEERRSDFNRRHFHDEIEFSGVFASGIGEYRVDLAVTDKQERTFHKSWTVKIAAHGKESKTPFTLKPDTAVSIALPPWRSHGESVRRDLRIAILLDAAPLFPFAFKLRAWDRAFLLSSLASLVRQINAGSTQVTAFNLDQQRIIFHDENFGHGSFRKLVESLQNLELGTVSYKTLQRQSGWLEVLLKLLNEQSQALRSPDAVVFLGPANRILAKVPREYLGNCQSLGSRLFYFEYYPYIGAAFPDSIQQIISTCHGSVYKIHTAADFAEAIEKMQRKMQADNVQSSRIP